MSIRTQIHMEGFVETKLYGLIMEAVDTEDIKAVYRYCNIYDIAGSLILFDMQTRERILSGMSKEDADEITADLRMRGPVALTDITDAIHRIFPIILLTLRKDSICLNDEMAGSLIDYLDVAVDEDEMLFRDANYRGVLNAVNDWRKVHGMDTIEEYTDPKIVDDRKILAEKGLILQEDSPIFDQTDDDLPDYVVNMSPSDEGYLQMKLLTSLMMGMDNRSVQLCVCREDIDTLVDILTYSSGDVRSVVLDNVAKRVREEIESKLGVSVELEQARFSAIKILVHIVDHQDHIDGVSYLSPIINMYIKGKDDDLEYGLKVCERTLATAQKLRDLCRYPVLLGMDYDGEIEMIGVDIDMPGNL
ncbi:MAG: hypothetical protein K6G12_09730 [Lachnospiraceae bacterium]|nr:hypothetical protein [Lachnospiraceae bacterium]